MARALKSRGMAHGSCSDEKSTINVSSATETRDVKLDIRCLSTAMPMPHVSVALNEMLEGAGDEICLFMRVK